MSILDGKSREADGAISPDGRWIIYSAIPLSRREVFLQALPREVAGGAAEAAGRFSISTNGGSQPAWGANGSEVFFVGPDSRMMVVAVDLRSEPPRIGVPAPLFQTALVYDTNQRQYDVTGDGQRFILAEARESALDLPITVIVNWPRLLRAQP